MVFLKIWKWMVLQSQVFTLNWCACAFFMWSIYQTSGRKFMWSLEYPNFSRKFKRSWKSIIVCKLKWNLTKGAGTQRQIDIYQGLLGLKVPSWKSQIWLFVISYENFILICFHMISSDKLKCNQWSSESIFERPLFLCLFLSNPQILCFVHCLTTPNSNIPTFKTTKSGFWNSIRTITDHMR